MRVNPPVTAGGATSTTAAEAVITMPIAVEITSPNSNFGGILPVSPLSSPARKDSGLESGEASDTSESQHATGATNVGRDGRENSDLYSKVPGYLTTVSVSNSDSRSVANEEDSKSYDR